MTPAGNLRARLEFQAHSIGDDGFGNPVVGPFETVFTADAQLRPLKGGETVMAGRLQGVQPYVCTIRSSSQSRQVTTAWRAIDARAGNDDNGDPKIIYQIKSPPADPDGRNAWLDMLIETGTPA